MKWCWTSNEHGALKTVKNSLFHAPTLALHDPDQPFSIICDASDFVIGSDLFQRDVEERERVIALDLGSSKLLKRNTQFITRSYLQEIMLSSNSEFICLNPSRLRSKPIMRHCALRPSRHTSLSEWLVGSHSLPNTFSR